MLLSITIAFISCDSSLLFSLLIESSVSLNTITLSFGCFFLIKSTAADSLFVAQLNTAFLFLTFTNHALTNPSTCPPLVNSKDIDLASYFLTRWEIFLILTEQQSYNFCSLSFSFTFNGIIMGLDNLSSYIESFLSIAAVSPKIALL